MTKLNQGADGVLVSAATKAGLASAPPDYTRTFENTANNYRRTVENTANMWNKIGSMAVIKFKEIKKAQQETREQNAGVAALANGDQLVTAINNIGDELRATSKLDGGFGGDPAKEERIKINKRKDKIYAFTESNANGEQVLNNMFNTTTGKNGKPIKPTIHIEATGAYPMEVASAYAQSQNGGTTDLGNYFVPEMGKDGKMAWTMYNDPKLIDKESKSIKENPFVTTPASVIKLEKDAKPPKPNGKPIMGVNGKKIRYTIGDINAMMVQIDPNMKDLVNGIYDQAFLSGKKSNGSVTLGKYQQNEMNDALDGISRKRQAWYQKTKYGEDSKSFHGELTNGASVASANLFGQLSNVVSGGAETLENTGVLAGINGMSDGVEGIQAADFQNEKNYELLTMTLFNPGNKNYDAEVTAGIFKEHMQAKIVEIQAHGWNRSARNPINKPGYVAPGSNEEAALRNHVPLKATINSSMFANGNGNDMREEQRNMWNSVAGAIHLRADMGKGNNKIYWDKDKTSYFHATKGVIPNKATLFMMINKNRDELTPSFKLGPFFKAIPDWDGKQYVKEEKVKKEDEGWKLFSPSTWGN